MNKIKKIHFVGIKGVGMTPLAIFTKEAGIEITGSDIEEEFITDSSLSEAGIKPLVGFSRSNIKDQDLIITTGAHGGLTNEEVIEAKKKNIPVWLQGQAVGYFMNGEIFGKDFFGISVAGSHGKTTTTSMIATILSESSLDPSYLIGTSEIKPLGLPGHFGKGKFFVSEADEYATDPVLDKTPKFLWQIPKVGLITSIELDHTDLYENVDQVREDFLKFANEITGSLVICGDDQENKKLIRQYNKNHVAYGFSPANDVSLEKLRDEGNRIYFWAKSRGTSIGEFILNIPGEFNVLNGLGAIATCLELGLSIDRIKEGLSKYLGAKRRFEYVGRLESGAMAYDDYGHHPTEVGKTLKAFRSVFKDKKVLCIFQPHTFSRTKAFFNEFVNSFSYADGVIVTDIYSSSREEKDDTVSSEDLVRKMSAIHNNAIYISDISSVVEYIIKKNLGEEYVIVTMGAGDIYKIWKKLELSRN